MDTYIDTKIMIDYSTNITYSIYPSMTLQAVLLTILSVLCFIVFLTSVFCYWYANGSNPLLQIFFNSPVNVLFEWNLDVDF
jgi:hypothetical protein